MSSSSLVLERDSWMRRIEKARRLTDELFTVVKNGALYERPIPERHRIVFYIGHLEAFDWNLLKGLAGNGSSRLSGMANAAELDRLFAFGIDPVDGGLPTDQIDDWPEMDVVRKYVAERRRAVDEVLDSCRQETGSETCVETLLHVALEHRLMHAETLAYMFHQLPYRAKCAPEAGEVVSTTGRWPPAGGETMAEIRAGTVTLGQRRGGMFGWDNEFGAFDVFVPGFEIDRYMVSNGQFLEFLEAGGYQDEKLWRQEDWQWRKEKEISRPVFWERRGTTWFYRGMFTEITLPLDWPVYVSYAEASAYANWRGMSLPSEAQWQWAAYGTPGLEQRSFPWGEEAPESVSGNFGFRRWDPEPVWADQKTNQSAFGVVGMAGNGWEWTSSEFAPFAGFQAFPFYPGYSANFFDGKHLVMKGGSARTAAPLLRRSFRNWFQPHYQFMYAGFRCISKAKD